MPATTTAQQAAAYFGTEFQEPEHWRLRRQQVLGRSPLTAANGGGATATAAKAPRAKKAPFTIEFVGEGARAAPTAAKLFVKGTSAINMTERMRTDAPGAENGFLLPEVVEAVDAKALMKLFTRSSWVSYKAPGQPGAVSGT